MKNFPKKFFTEFKEFISKGNALDLAVCMMVGSAFTAIVTSFVNDLFTPLLNLIFNKKAEDGSTISFVDNVSWHGIQFGSFINAIITFILTAFCLFVIIKAINSLRNIGKKKKEEAPAAPTTKICPFCKSEIDIDATRCPHCTSELPAEDVEAAASKED